MAEYDKDKQAKEYHLDTPVNNYGFFLKGAHSLDWGMKNRLSRIFRPETGKTVMLAIDHGYFQGPTTGLERPDVNIVPLMPYADAIMLTRGILRTTVPPSLTKAVVMRCSGGPSILKELSDEELAVDIEDAIRMNVAAITLQIFVGGEYETRSIHNMTRLVDMGLRYGIPTMAVTAVGKDLVRDAKYFRLACRMAAELGAQIVKTYYVPEEFETITASCPVPIVMAGGKNLVIEFIDGQVKVYDNPLGVMTNRPDFEWQVNNLRNYINLDAHDRKDKILNGLKLEPTGVGSGLLGLPGDWTPPSRFVRVAYSLDAALPAKNAPEALNLAEHLLNIVDIPKGAIEENPAPLVHMQGYAQWVVIKDLTNLTLYYKTYENTAWKKVDLKKFSLAPGAPQKSIVIDDKVQKVIDVTGELK